MPRVNRRHALSVCATLIAGAMPGLCFAQANDNCSAPEAIAGYGAFITSNVGATTDGAADAACNFFSSQQIWADVWMCWTATESGIAIAETCGSGFDTKIAAYLGCGCGGTILACNDDACSLQSRVTFAVTAGEQYTLRLGSYSSNGTTIPTGEILLTTRSGALADLVNPANGHRYVAYDTSGWNAAEATAQLLGGHLVTIDDADENAWVHDNFGNLNGTDRRIWIGFSDAATEGTFAWADGSPVGYTNWNPGEPNNSGGTEDYAEMLGSNGQWNDLNEAGSGYVHIAIAELGPATLPCSADLNHDGQVDGADLGELLGNWNGSGVPSDLNADGIVNGADLGQLLGSWGACP